MVTSRATLLSLLLATLSAGCGGSEPLAFVPRPLPIGHDAQAVFDAVLVDLHGRGGLSVVAATAAGPVLLARHDTGWEVASASAALDRVAPVQRLVLAAEVSALHAGEALSGTHVGRPAQVGDAAALDLLVLREDRRALLASSGIGSWHERELPPDNPRLSEGAFPPAALELLADLDGDGLPDRAALDGRRVRVWLRDADGRETEVTRQIGADALLLAAPGTALLAGDVDGDGDLDLLAVGGRLLLLLNNGGRFERSAAAAVAPDFASAASAPSPGTGGSPGTATRPWFTDVTAELGVNWSHREGDEQWDIRPTMGPGCAFADVSGDGRVDLYVVGGTEQDGLLLLNSAPADAGGDMHFRDVTEAWGLAEPLPRGAGMGAAFADIDNDGRPDLYITRDGPNLLLRHDGDRFTDISAASGTDDARWGAGVAFADFDRDGDLDLYVTNYLHFDRALIPPDDERPGRQREDPIAMLPYVFPGQFDVLYRNDGGGRFTDITEAAGLEGQLDPGTGLRSGGADGKGLGVLVFDLDEDGWPDLHVVNDTTPNQLWRNLGNWRAAGAGADAQATGGFEEIALHVGLDDPRGGMGAAAADLDGDGDEELFVSNWQLEANALYRNNTRHLPTARRFVPRFEDISVPSGLAQPSVGVVGWGCVLEDLDLDGDLDLFVVNGYTSPDYETTMICVGQPDHLYENTSVGEFVEHRDLPRFTLLAPERAGGYFARALPGRGVAAADWDGDGDLDLAITNNNGPLILLRNDRIPETIASRATGAAAGTDAGADTPRSLRVRLRGNGVSVPTDAVGARVSLTTTDGRRQSRRVRLEGSYLSGHEPGAFFGLGRAAPQHLIVDWPDGSRIELRDAELAERVEQHGARGLLSLRQAEPESAPAPAAGSPPH